MAGMDDFVSAVNDAALAFPENKLCRRVVAGQIGLPDYHAVLQLLFHITYEGAAVSALAAAQCPPDREAVRAYLLHQADQVKDHWRWVLNDLEATGFTGTDPRQGFPSPACQSYIAYNYYVALRAPVARLAVIAVMNAIAGSFSQNYSAKLFQILKLKPSQASFFFRSSGADDELMAVIRATPMDGRDWLWMANAARTASTLYRAVYDTAMA
ncbi:MAG: hypothetical protein HZC25_00345 [Rhodospirillales bacterium]|nr:hypothetical protein [Rhodospirillales bacterium]